MQPAKQAAAGKHAALDDASVRIEGCLEQFVFHEEARDILAANVPRKSLEPLRHGNRGGGEGLAKPVHDAGFLARISLHDVPVD